VPWIDPSPDPRSSAALYTGVFPPDAGKSAVTADSLPALLKVGVLYSFFIVPTIMAMPKRHTPGMVISDPDKSTIFGCAVYSAGCNSIGTESIDLGLSAEDRLLVACADPLAALPADATASPDRLETLLKAAELHGVRAILLRKLREQPGRSEHVASELQRLHDRSTFEAGQSLLLRHQGAQVRAGFDARGVSARIVKGPVFADRLYAHAADRPFTDIDFLVRKADMGKAGQVMQGLGYELPMGPEQSSILMEYKWHLSTNPGILVELHADLVHLPGLRRRLSLDFDRLAAIDGGEPDSPASLLVIAVVHAAGGHKFHRLQLLVDVLQAVRGLRSEQDGERALGAARQCGASLEFATVLDVTGRTFVCQPALHLAARAASTLSSRIARRLVTPQAILEAGTGAGWGSRLRRDAFRWVQRLARQ
jgi:hypothetical protein